MRIKHSFDSWSLAKEGEGSSFILNNRNGGYACFSSKPGSRYEGFFIYHNQRMFRIIENISCDPEEVSLLHNKFHKVEQKRGLFTESFFVPFHQNIFCYGLDKKGSIQITLDVKDSYDNRVWGRHYEITKEKECTVVHFTKKTDGREDRSHGIVEYEFYMAFKSDGNINQKGSWVERFYEKDAARNSYPANRYVYEALSIEGSRVVMALSQKKEQAISECVSAYARQKALEKQQEKNILDCVPHKTMLKKMPLQHAMAYIACAVSLQGLCVPAGKRKALLAGLPWFYQIWARDELISLKAMVLLKQYDVVVDALKRHSGMVIDGTLLNNLSGDLPSADAFGWLFVRARELDKKSKIEKMIPLALWERFARAQGKKSNGGGFIPNSAKETWMDSIERDGIRLEIEALQLAVYQFLFEKTKKKEFKVLEERLLKNVRSQFWNGTYLYDGLTDIMVRPNVFIACYVYPQLLTREEWKKCMDHVLKKLWLDFGGLSTIDITSALFQPNHTGENPKSYHNGDSWFWINSLAAICLLRTDKKKFKEHIEKIISASSEEILWKGAVGHHAEVSSASHLASQGCLQQAWSDALFIELMHEING